MKNRTPGFPAITALLSALTLALWHIPGAAETFQLDRSIPASQGLWRLFTCHFTHWTTSHLAWDLAAFALLGVLVEWRSRRLLAATLAASALAISAAIWLLEPGLATYRGLSGLDSALFAALLPLPLTEAIRQRRWPAALVPALAALAFAAKIGLEMQTVSAVFVASDAAFEPVPLAHVVGGFVGLIVSLSYSSSANAAQVVAAWPCGSPTGRRRSM